LLRDWGQDRKYHHAVRGYNYRMEGITGAVLNAKLSHLPAWTEARRAIAARYDAALEGAPVTRPSHTAGHVFHTYTIRSSERDRLQQHLTNAGIGTAIHYPIPLHLQPAYADARWPEGSLPQAEEASREVLSLPIYPEMPLDHVDEVAAAIRRFR
jgi:dTDP-4-amino-4,6-dideoxygalactose transaminase